MVQKSGLGSVEKRTFLTIPTHNLRPFSCSARSSSLGYSSMFASPQSPDLIFGPSSLQSNEKSGQIYPQGKSPIHIRLEAKWSKNPVWALWRSEHS
jgi:hypothetical protein